MSRILIQVGNYLNAELPNDLFELLLLCVFVSVGGCIAGFKTQTKRTPLTTANGAHGCDFGRLVCSHRVQQEWRT